MEVHIMKRDLDLARQLLLDIEHRGTDCSVSVLRSAKEFDRTEISEERIRYHLRLLIDAGLLKEIDRTSSGIPCVRLTNEGHELLELSRPEGAWREAKYVCQQRIGGLSLQVISDILLQWAIAGSERVRYRRPYSTRRLRYETEPVRDRLGYRVEPYRTLEHWEERDFEPVDNVRYVRVKPSEERVFERRYGIDLDGDGRVDVEYDSTGPTYLI